MCNTYQKLIVFCIILSCYFLLSISSYDQIGVLFFNIIPSPIAIDDTIQWSKGNAWLILNY